MKNTLLVSLAAFMMLISQSALAAKFSPTCGRVVNVEQEAVSYATVVLSRDNQQVAGTATNDKGEFSFLVEDGAYELIVSYVGYQTYSATIEGGKDLGEIELLAESTQIDDVVVTSNFISRKADRFVVDVANAPSSIGQDGEDLLKSSPGVWVMEDEISINGNSNPKVFVNDRELKMSAEQIMTYLRNLKSDDVRRIEVIPQSGADFDASSSSGVIMIYLRRQLNSGVIGSVGLRSGYNSSMLSVSPSANINFQSEKLTLNTSGWYNRNANSSEISNDAFYNNIGSELKERSYSDDLRNSLGGRIEAIYAFNDRHSLGGELSYYRGDSSSNTKSNSVMSNGVMEQINNSLFDSSNNRDNLSATFNYIYKLDTLGSTLKLLADYNKNSSNGFDDNMFVVSGVDSLHQSRSVSDFKVSTATLALEKIIKPTLSIKAGVKFTHNDMDSRSKYSYFKEPEWVDLTSYNSDELYTEDISAAYVIGTSRMGKWSMVAGLRGEYTQTQGRDQLLDKNYFSWFPNVNVSYLFDDRGANSLTAQYSRSISRPSFWSLNPARQQASEYFYQMGNPALLPEYGNKISLTYVYKYKYSLTASTSIAENSSVQVMIQDENNPDVVCIMPKNISNQYSYFVSTNLPFQITKWWNLNANVTYGYRGEQLSEHAATQYQHMLFANGQTTFTLPKEYYINLSCYAMSGMYSGNIHMSPRNFTTVSVSKKLFDKSLNISLAAYNIFSQEQTVTSTMESVKQIMVSQNAWSKPRLGFSISYNFKAGKEYQYRQGVESASSEDKARLSGGGEGN